MAILGFVLPQLYPNTPNWVLRSFLYLGLFLIFCPLIFLLYKYLYGLNLKNKKLMYTPGIIFIVIGITWITIVYFDLVSSSKTERKNEQIADKKTEIIDQLNQFVRNGNELLLQINSAHSSQFPAKYPLPKNMKPSPMELIIAEWSKDVYNYLIADVQIWAEYYHSLSTRDIVKNHKPYTIPQEKYRTSMIAIMESRIDRILEIIKRVESSSN
ncbi:MAG: hypothetical protein H8D23_26450 [Candidatus Brocadiales bacterium]|nr:hypothetical protein [Candidatus Brocadiales bacterium]